MNNKSKTKPITKTKKNNNNNNNKNNDPTVRKKSVPTVNKSNNKSNEPTVNKKPEQVGEKQVTPVVKSNRYRITVHRDPNEDKIQSDKQYLNKLSSIINRIKDVSQSQPMEKIRFGWFN